MGAQTLSRTRNASSGQAPSVSIEWRESEDRDPAGYARLLQILFRPQSPDLSDVADGSDDER